jgi:DNA-3-methyladenine glycosylase
VTKGLAIDGSYNREDLVTSGRIRIEETGLHPLTIAGPRIGIAYAGEPWVSMPWRFIIKNE